MSVFLQNCQYDDCIFMSFFGFTALRKIFEDGCFASYGFFCFLCLLLHLFTTNGGFTPSNLLKTLVCLLFLKILGKRRFLKGRKYILRNHCFLSFKCLNTSIQFSGQNQPFVCRVINAIKFWAHMNSAKNCTYYHVCI